MKFTISLYASICLFLFIGCTSKPKQQEVQTNEDISQNNDAKVLEEFPNTDTTLQVIPPIKVTPKKTKPTDNDIQYNITYKGKNNIVKAVDIFKNIQYVPLETNDKSLLASLLTVVICKNGYIYGKQAWSSLGEGYDVDEVLVRKPFPFDQFCLDRCNHRYASTNSERSYLCKNLKYLPVRNHIGGKIIKIFSKIRNGMYRRFAELE